MTPATQHRLPGALARRHAGSCRASGHHRRRHQRRSAYTIAGALAATQPSIGNTGWPSFGGAPDLLARRQARRVQLLGVDLGATRRRQASRSATLDYDRRTRCSPTSPSSTRRRRATASWSSFLPTNDAVVFERRDSRRATATLRLHAANTAPRGELGGSTSPRKTRARARQAERHAATCRHGAQRARPTTPRSTTSRR